MQLGRTAKWLISLIAIALILGVLIGYVVPRQLAGLNPMAGGTRQQLNTAVVLDKIQGLSQLVTVKYVLEKVVVLEDAKWYGENRVLLVASGVVKAGINFDRMQPGDVDLVDGRIVVFLPPAEITDVYLDEDRTHVIEHATGLLREFDKDLQQDARRRAIADIRTAARYNNIIKDAEERAKLQLELFFRELGFTEVDIRTH